MSSRHASVFLVYFTFCLQPVVQGFAIVAAPPLIDVARTLGDAIEP